MRSVMLRASSLCWTPALLAFDPCIAVVGLEHAPFRVMLPHLKPLSPVESLGRVGGQNAQPEGNAEVLGLCDDLPEDDRAHPTPLEAWKQVKLIEEKMVHMTRGLDASSIETIANDDAMPARDGGSGRHSPQRATA